MRRAVLALLALALGCGDNRLPLGADLGHADHLVLVAHQDDDLLFMQPDLIEAIKRGESVTTIYVTAGNGTKGLDYAQTRSVGAQAAYADAAGASAWSCGEIFLDDHAAQSCVLTDHQITLITLGYPDGGKQGEATASLLHLWEGAVPRATTIARRTTTYDRDALITTLADVITAVTPRTIHTLDIAATHGRDHSDHMMVGALALLAQARAHADAALISYRGYNVEGEPANKLDPIYDRSAEALGRYNACVLSCGAVCFESGCADKDPSHETWLRRRYAVGFRRAPGTTLTGALRHAGRCLAVNADGGALLGDCATSWTFTTDGQLTLGGRCLQTLPTGELVAGSCGAAASRSFQLDDEGHLWVGVAPLPDANLDYAHLQCVVVAGDRPRAGLCGQDTAIAWDLVTAPTSTPRATLGLTQHGRALRLGDLTGDHHADLCEARPSGLWCAAGDGHGGFAPATRLDDPGAPFVVEPQSLALGDVDYDGRLDACGRTATGVTCALAAQAFVPRLLTTTFAATGPATAADRALTIVDATGDGHDDVCGRLGDGTVTCITKRDIPLFRTAWPAADAPLWFADLDGDRHADWCAATATGVACGLDAERGLTADGAPWAYAQGGVAEVVGPPELTSLADVDGDHLADVCTIVANAVRCARGQGYGSSPSFALPLDGTAALGLVLGDLDGDGKADACVDTAVAISCAISP